MQVDPRVRSRSDGSWCPDAPGLLVTSSLVHRTNKLFRCEIGETLEAFEWEGTTSTEEVVREFAVDRSGSRKVIQSLARLLNGCWLISNQFSNII